MPVNYSCIHLPALQETQDIAEYVDAAWSLEHNDECYLDSRPEPPRTSSASSNPTNTIDRSIINCSSTEEPSSSTKAGLRKFRDGWGKGLLVRIRRKPLPGYTQGSMRKYPATDIEPTRVSQGVWKDQLLVDRSLRSMSLLMTTFAIALIVVVATNAKAFSTRANKFSSSVGGEPRDCKTVTQTNTGLLLLINAGATAVLGMSNTYQQIVTSLQPGDLMYMFRKFGDSRVGTNSPWNINHKKEGKAKAWAAWLLLVCTSLPIHFLANSLIGPSYIINPPIKVTSTERFYEDLWLVEARPRGGSTLTLYSSSFVCWSAFRTGKASFPQSTSGMIADFTPIQGKGLMYDELYINYSKENCSGFAGTWDQSLASLEIDYLSPDLRGGKSYSQDTCKISDGIYCFALGEKSAQCRLNVRMSAAYILAVALSIKAIYMVTTNFKARGHVKRQLLTFGDVVVASASHSELRVQGECLVNAKESYRRHCSHACHKHCKSKTVSKTGGEVGHCQKCKKWNSVVHLTNEIQPTVATKIKRSLITNLGDTALAQITILTFCSLFMVAISIVVALPLDARIRSIKSKCARPNNIQLGCERSYFEHFSTMSGGWGGFNHSTC